MLIIKKHIKTELCIKQFVFFIKKQIRKCVKYLQLDLFRQFGIKDLKSCIKKKKIKMELTVAYNSKINSIAERRNGFIVFKVRYLFIDTFFKIG